MTAHHKPAVQITELDLSAVSLSQLEEIAQYRGDHLTNTALIAIHMAYLAMLEDKRRRADAALHDALGVRLGDTDIRI